MRVGKIVGMGAVAMDIVLQCEALPREDGFSFIHNEQLMHGGSCANVLVTLQKLGNQTSLIAMVGDDSYGSVFLDELVNDSVETKNVMVKKGGTTLHTFITVDKKGARAIFVNTGDCLLNYPENNIADNMLDNADLFYTDLFPAKPALKLARKARKKDIPVVFVLECTPSFMNLCGTSTDEINDMLSICQLFCAGGEALEEFTQENDALRAAEKVYNRFQPDNGVVVTMGSRGAAWLNNRKKITVPAFSVDPVDSTGAGDAFAGGLIHKYFMKGVGEEEALNFAAACGAIKCTTLGARFQFNEKQVLQLQEKQCF